MTAQHPIPSGLGAHTTAREALGTRDLGGTTVIVTGGYCEDCDVASTVASGAPARGTPTAGVDPPATSGVRPWAVDPALAERLWTMSETATGVPFTI